MAGWDALRRKERMEEVLRFKSNMDSGMFLPVQLAAAKALTLGKEWYDEVNAIYGKRRKKAHELLQSLKCEYAAGQAGMFVWAHIPDGCESGYVLSDELLHGAGVFITPGGIFGEAGNLFVRLSLVQQ